MWCTFKSHLSEGMMSDFHRCRRWKWVSSRRSLLPNPLRCVLGLNGRDGNYRPDCPTCLTLLSGFPSRRKLQPILTTRATGPAPISTRFSPGPDLSQARRGTFSESSDFWPDPSLEQGYAVQH